MSLPGTAVAAAAAAAAATSAGETRVRGVHAPTLDALREVVPGGRPGDSCQWVVADASLGGWRAHQVASELCAQLGVALPMRPARAAARPPPPGDRMPSYADLISTGIDAEAIGDQATLTALAAAERVAATVLEGPRRTVLVIVPRYGLAWEREDLLFVRLLASRLESAGERLVLVYADPADGPADGTDELRVEWLNPPQPAQPPLAGGLAGLVPGTVEPEVAAALRAAGGTGAGAGGALEGTLPLAHGHLLVMPELRRCPSERPRLEYDRFAAVVGQFGWLRGYAQCLGNNVFVEPQFLGTQAWQCFADGAGGVALRLLDRARSCAATLLERATVECQAAGMRIALRRFAAAARAPDPSPALPAEIRAFLLQAKGYGLVMFGEQDPAQACLHAARALLDPETGCREYLYLLNILALARLRAGDALGALEIEREIESRAAGLRAPDWQLRYVNSVNIARLGRRLGDLETARRYYDDAFSTTLGVRSESEAIYSNGCLARLDMERGCADQAFLGWLRAALHWLAARAPEALGPRVSAALVGHVPVSPAHMLEEVSEALLSSLATAARASGRGAIADAVTRADLERPAPTFLRADCLTSAAAWPEWAFGGPGWSVLGTGRRQPAAAARVEPGGRRRLSALVRDLLLCLSDADELAAAQTLVIDERSGQEIATTAYELLESCVRLRIPRVHFLGSHLELDAAARRRLEWRARVRLGKAVERVVVGAADVTVTFRRSLPAAVVPLQDGLILAQLDVERSPLELVERLPRGPGPVPGPGLDGPLGRLRVLEESRTLNFSLTEESCTTAGIWWPSTASLPEPSPR